MCNAGSGAGFVNYCGYADCIKLENQNTRVILGPHCGGEYSLNGVNCLYIDHCQNGWAYKPGKETIDPGGGRLDIGPEKTIPAHPDLWLGPWKAEITGEMSAQMTGIEDRATGVQLIRDFVLDKRSSKLLLTQTIRNVSDRTQQWCHWSRTLALGGGICIIPLSATSRFPHKYIMYETGTLINYEPKDPNIVAGDDYIKIPGTPRYPKLGMDSAASWLCYLTKNDLLFVKRFPVYPDRPYSEIAAITISIWYYKDVMCELEPIGPKENIPPGASASFTEQWWLVPCAFPTERSKVDAAEIARLVAGQAD